MELREYQVRAVEMANESLKQHASNLLCMPCGAGKTEVAMRMMLDEVGRGGRCLFVAHRRELIRQTSKRFLDRTGTKVGIYMAGHMYVNNPIQICSVQTMAARGHMPPATMIVIDEAHLSLAKSYVKLAQQAKHEGIKVVGLTASPYRLNPKEHFRTIYDDYSIPIQPKELIGLGYQMQPTIYHSENMIEGSKLQVKNNEYTVDSYVSEFNRAGGVRTLLHNWVRHAELERTIIFNPSIQVAHEVADAFTDAGYPFAVIDSRQDAKENDRAIRAFADGTIMGLSNVNMVSEGFDVPDCSCVVMNISTKSLPRWIQPVGRCQRPSPFKGRAIVIDNSDHTARLGPPWQDIVPQMEPAAVKKKKEAEEPKEKRLGVRKELEVPDDPHLFIEVGGELLTPYQPEDGFYKTKQIAAFPRPMNAFGREVARRFGPIKVCGGLVMPAYFENAAPEDLDVQDRRTAGYRAYVSILEQFQIPKAAISKAWEIRKLHSAQHQARAAAR